MARQPLPPATPHFLQVHAIGRTVGTQVPRACTTAAVAKQFLFLEGAEVSKTPLQHLDQTALARRSRISPRSLERWRWLRQGPAYLKVGGKVLYRITDIEAYEQAQLRQAGA